MLSNKSTAGPWQSGLLRRPYNSVNVCKHVRGSESHRTRQYAIMQFMKVIKRNSMIFWENYWKLSLNPAGR